MEQDKRHHLSGFDGPAHRRLNSRGSGYTFFVKATKMVLPVVALVLIGIVTYRLSGPQLQNLVPDAASAEKTEAGQIELEGAKYDGVDAEGHAYSVSSALASRAPDNEKKILLTSPEADIAVTAKTTVSLSADKGDYDSDSGELRLTDNVRLHHNEGYELRMTKLDINVKTHEAYTESAVEGEGPAGTIKASGLAVEDKGNLVVFKGPAVMTIIDKPAKPAMPQEKEG